VSFLLEHSSHPVGFGCGGTVEVLVLGGNIDVGVPVEVLGVMRMEGPVDVAPIQIPFEQHALSTT
jgi:hypothetical protein